MSNSYGNTPLRSLNFQVSFINDLGCINDFDKHQLITGNCMEQLLMKFKLSKMRFIYDNTTSQVMDAHVIQRFEYQQSIALLPFNNTLPCNEKTDVNDKSDQKNNDVQL